MLYLFISNSVLILMSILYWLFTTNLINEYPHLIRIPAPLFYLLGPTMYLFVRSLLYKEKIFFKLDWLHFLPFFLHLLPFDGGLINGSWHYLLKTISWIIYFVLSVNIYSKFRKKIKTNIITDYNRKFIFIRFFLITRLLGFIIWNLATLFIVDSQSIISVFIVSNIIGLINVFFLLFEYPEMIYGDDFYSVKDNNRENLMKIVMNQTENLKFLENSKHEANILLDVDYKVIYFNKLAEIKFFDLYNYKLELNTDFTTYLDEISKQNFINYFTQSLQGKPIQTEEKFMLFNQSDFTWLQISFTAHYSENGNIIGVSVGATAIDAKRKMEQLQSKYLQSLDELAWNSSHILRAPVANMIGIIKLLHETDISLSDSEKKYFLTNLSKEVNGLDAVIKQMVSKARKELDN